MPHDPQDTSPTSPAQPDGDGPAGRPDSTPSGEGRRQGVLRQRQHIKDLTGEDPLRGGIAD